MKPYWCVASRRLKGTVIKTYGSDVTHKRTLPLTEKPASYFLKLTSTEAGARVIPEGLLLQVREGQRGHRARRLAHVQLARRQALGERWIDALLHTHRNYRQAIHKKYIIRLLYCKYFFKPQRKKRRICAQCVSVCTHMHTAELQNVCDLI